MSATRLVGVGAATGYGWGFDALVSGLRSRTSAGRAQEVEGVEQVAATIPDASSGPEADASVSRFERVARAAVTDAVADATARGWQSGDDVGIIFCTGIGDIVSMRDNYMREARPRPSLFPRLLHTSVGSLLSQEHGWQGPNLVLNAACSSGNVALQLADGWLRAGSVSDVIVAGAELCLAAEIVTGFRRLRVLLGPDEPIELCRPFQEGSRRFFLGEAGIGLVVTRADGVRPRATYLGGAQRHDAHHLVAPAPDGVALARCVRDSLTDAGVTPADIAVVKAHGSGTPINDSVEQAVVDELFPPETRLCTYKPLVGHAMGAASLVELAALLAGYEVGELPRFVTDAPAHPRLAAGGTPPPGLALCASVGLGGANAAVVLDIPVGGNP